MSMKFLISEIYAQRPWHLLGKLMKDKTGQNLRDYLQISSTCNIATVEKEHLFEHFDGVEVLIGKHQQYAANE